MKARKAAVCLFAVFAAYCPVQGVQGYAAEEEPETAAITVETAAADVSGDFAVTVYLDELPESGLCALDFAIGYDAAAIRIDQVELLYDTGAQDAEILVDPQLADTVFTYEDMGGELRIRWVTVLEDREYWLSEERSFFTVRGKVRKKMQPGTASALEIIPASRDDGSGGTNDRIIAGYIDDDGNVHTCETRLTNGAVWKPIDETGATMYGDLDLSGQITAADAVLLDRALAEDIALSAAAYANADCEFNGVLTIADVTRLLKVVTKQLDPAALGAR